MWPAFGNPWMLAGLAAVGLPILIHYLTRARPRRIAFPPFKFLQEACAGQQAVHRLRTLILLALRTLALLALVLVFARPFLKPSGQGAGSPSARRLVVVLDGSLSMRAVQRGLPLFARAKAEVADLLRGLESGSETGVIVAGARPRPLLPALSKNTPALHEALVRAEAGYEFADIPAALALAQRMLGGAGEVYVFSDFQQSNWEQIGALPAGMVGRLRSIATEPVANVALTSAQVSPAEPVAGEPAEIVCSVFNCTPRPRQETVRLELGELTPEARVMVPPFGTASAVFTLAFPQPGTFVGRASLAPDDLPEDNTRHLAVRVHKALQLLLVSDADASDQRSAAFFVSRALAPSERAAPGLTLVRRHGQDTDRGVLETADGFVLVAPASLSGETVEIMARRVNEGAPLVVWLDGPAAPALVPSTFAPPFRLLAPVASSAGDILVPGPRKLFAEADAADWAPVRLRRHFRTELLDGRGGDVMLAYPDGSAALTLSRLGKGAVVFANLPLTADGGDLMGSPMFPAMQHELLRAMRRNADDRAITPGVSWSIEGVTGGDAAVTVVDPEGKPVEAPTIAVGRTTRLAMPAATLPGAYLLKQADATIGAGVVNIDPRESDTRPIALERIKSGTGALVTVVQGEEELLATADAHPLWPQCAAAAAGLFALEMALLALWRPARAIRGSRREEDRFAAVTERGRKPVIAPEREEVLR